MVEAFSASIPAKQVIDVNPAAGNVGAPELDGGAHGIEGREADLRARPRRHDDRRGAQAARNRWGSTLNVAQQTESDTIPANVIASQDPAAVGEAPLRIRP